MALTGKNEVLGTLYYMSPKQLQAPATGQKIDSRTDIFSFGVVLYEMLTGNPPFRGSSPASVIAAIMERPAPSIKGVGPAVVDRVLKTCLAKVRIPMKWGTDSGASGAASERAALVTAMISEVPHLSQEFCECRERAASFRFHHLVSA